MNLGVVSLDTDERLLCAGADADGFFGCECVETSRGVIVRVFRTGVSMYLYIGELSLMDGAIAFKLYLYAQWIRPTS